MKNLLRTLKNDKIMNNLIKKRTTLSITHERLKSYDELPGPKALPFFGNLFSLKGFGGTLNLHPFDKFVEEINKYGDLVKWSLLGSKEIFIFKPEHVKIMFQAEGSVPARPIVIPWQIYSKRKNYPSGLINSQTDEWKKQRTASNPIVARPQSAAAYLNIHNKIIDEFVELLIHKCKNSGNCIVEKFQNRIRFLTLEMMSIVAFDHRLNCINDEKRDPVIFKLLNSIEAYSNLTAKLYYSVPLWTIFKTPDWIEFEKVSDFIFDFTRKYVEESKNLLANNSNQNIKNTMLQNYLINQEKSNLKFEEIVSLMSELLLAAFDTTSATLHFLLQIIGSNPEIQEELYQEIVSNYPNDNYIDENILAKVPLLKACLKESQRMYLLAPSLGRIISEDIILDGYLIPKNDPGLFIPHRWLKHNQKTDNINPYSMLPFGFGSRMCIGRRLAEQKMYLILIKLIKNFKIEYVGGEVKKIFRLLSVPDFDLDLKFSRR